MEKLTIWQMVRKNEQRERGCHGYLEQTWVDSLL